jgi:hypothetical protein
VSRKQVNGTKLTDIDGEVYTETEKAYLFYDGAKKEWLPKSQCQWDETLQRMTMPEWLATDKGLI